MIVYSTHQKIDAIKKILPDGFVFVLDTTDRSFIYKSKSSHDHEEFVILLDREKGIDALTKNRDSYTYEDDYRILQLQKIGENTFLGLCADKASFTLNQFSLTKSYIQN